MIRRVFILTLIILEVLCYPYPEGFRIPDLNVSPPEEVNSLTHNHYSRSINTEANSPNSIDETVKEVEDIIKSNPALPRLTRGEILDLLENITKTDMDKLNIYSEVRDPKAIMVVMPFTPSNNDASNMEELYTKQPVTHIIGAEPFKKTDISTSNKPIIRRKPTRTTDLSHNEEEKQYGDRQKTSTTPTEEKPSRLKQETNDKKTHTRRRRPQVTTEAPTTRISQRRRTTRYPNHKYPDEDSINNDDRIPSNGIRIIKPPKLVPSSDESTDLNLQEDTQEEVYVLPHIAVQSHKGIKKPIYQKSTTPEPLEDEINIPEHLKPIMAAMNLEQAINGQTSEKLNEKPSNMDESEKIKTMLASIGVLPISTSTSSTTTLLPDVKDVADTLSPDMKDLLMSFGLIPNTNKQPKLPENFDTYYPTQAEVKPESYTGFKPLPDDTSTRNEMEEILSSFGLLRNGRNEKSLKKAKNTGADGELNFDMVPESLRSVLTDIGLTERNGKKIRTEKIEKTLGKQHVFNPVDSEYASDEEIVKLNKLLDMIKQLEKLNGTATEEDLKKIDITSLKQLVNGINDEKVIPLDEQKNAPNPVNYDNGLSKNEVKRQESTTASTTTKASVNETVKSSSIKDLEDSFGGQLDSTSETAPPETTTAAKRTGFYHLVDWNTFLDIDDQKGKRVNLRFQPKIGDPKRFLSVTVP